MNEHAPIVVGGNGHSGTRIFIEILGRAGLFTGLFPLTKRRNSEDLRIIDLLNKWVGPYVEGALAQRQLETMKREFARRLRILFPVRITRWGFKNPRSMLILPVLHELFPSMKFVHVIRDGRDIALGNAFVSGNRYVDLFLCDEERKLPPEQKMILFWGRSNHRAMQYGTDSMPDRYLLMKWEDLCRDPLSMTEKLIRFAGGNIAAAKEASKLIAMPSSIGRWRTFPPADHEAVLARGKPWLSLFDYE